MPAPPILLYQRDSDPPIDGEPLLWVGCAGESAKHLHFGVCQERKFGFIWHAHVMPEEGCSIV
jgi:hypothetical protein